MAIIFIPYLVMDDGGYIESLWFGSGAPTKDEAFASGRKMQRKFEGYNVGIKVKKLGVFDMKVDLKGV